MRLYIAIFIIQLSGCFSIFAEVVDFGFATIDLPKTTHNSPSKESGHFVGKFVSTDGTPTIQYEIGQDLEKAPETIDLSKFLLFQKGQINGFDYYATVMTTNPHFLEFMMFRPGFVAFDATVSSQQEIEKVLALLKTFTIKQAEQGAAANP